MIEIPNELQSIECRIVMIEAHSMQILTTASESGPSLPCVSIPAYCRVAEALTDVIEQRYGLGTIQLALLPGAQKPSYCAVHEIIGSAGAVPGSLFFTRLDDVVSGELTSEERETVFKIMSGRASELGRFARLGWIDELFAKTGVYQGRDSSPTIRHLNQGIDFCLLSLTDSSGRKLWFKAVGEPNTHEYALTQELARRFPAYLPMILATIHEWHGWLMEDVQGVRLSESDTIHSCEQALTALAIMQEEMAGDVASLSALGAKDWTCTRIASLLEPFFLDAQCAMQAQVSTRSKPLPSSALCQLKEDIGSALHQIRNAGIPDTLLHGDIGHGNIIATSKGPVFLDWAETYIGHPFLSAEHLLADLTRSSPVFAEAQAILRHHYAARWKDHVRSRELERVTALAPAIGAFAYAIIAWDTNRNRLDPTQAWPLIRSMLRRTNRELEHTAEVIA